MMTQAYHQYTGEDSAVWHKLFERQVEHLQGKASQAYLDAIDMVAFTAGRIPKFEEVNERLSHYTGWQLEVVPGIIPPAQFFGMLSRGRFPASTWLRSLENLDYLKEPDMFHDVFGHVPLLSDAAYTAFFTGLANLGLRYSTDALVTEWLNRIYWFTIEFGLLREKGELRIYGAGILSSYGETDFSLSSAPTHLPFDVDRILDMPFENDHIQDTYFVLDSMEQLYSSLPAISHGIERRLEALRKRA